MIGWHPLLVSARWAPPFLCLLTQQNFFNLVDLTAQLFKLVLGHNFGRRIGQERIVLNHDAIEGLFEILVVRLSL